jgi:alpha-N-arabinofuranosidase
MKLLGVGNEQWGPQYLERYTAFAQALKARYPEIQLVSSAGPRPNDDLFEFLWPKLKVLKADIIDEHCYDLPAWFLNNATRYDTYDRNGPKVFMGEYAAQSVKTVSPDNRNNWECALAEAAYMTGLERNAEVVVMASYAPLLAHTEGWQWKPNLIWFDNLQVYGTPNYYVQQLFSLHRGDALLPLQVSGVPETPDHQPRFYASASRQDRTGDLILKVVNATAEPATAVFQLNGAEAIGRGARAIVLTSPALTDENSLAQPHKVVPREQPLTRIGPSFSHAFPPYSLTILRIPLTRRVSG